MSFNNINNAESHSFISRKEKLRICLFWSLSIIVIAISLLFFALSAVKSYMGVTLELEETGWVVESVDTSGAANKAGIIAGDRPVEINGQLAQIFLQNYEKAGMVTEILLKELTVIDNNGQVKTVNVEQSTPTASAITILLSQLIVSLVFWATAFYIFFKKPKHTATWLFCFCSLAFGLTLSATAATGRGIPPAPHLAVLSMLFARFYYCTSSLFCQKKRYVYAIVH
jgi:hypothetical protein